MTRAPDVVLVAGATGRIGAAVCQLVLAGGGSVAAVVRRPWQVAPTRLALGAERVLVGCVPSGDPEAAAGFVKGAHDALGPLTGFVGAARRHQPRAPGDEPGGDLGDVLAANLLANTTLARAALPGMRRRRAGRLVLLGADAAAVAAGSTAFAASVGAVHAWVRALAHELDGTGVAVHAVAVPAAAGDDATAIAATIVAVLRGERAGEPLSALPT